MSWFREELNELQRSPRVSLFLHTTRPSPPNESENEGPSVRASHADEEKKHIAASHTSSSKGPDAFNVDLEKEKGSHVVKQAVNPWDSTTSLDLAPGRPDVDALIRDVVARSNHGERIAIVACGPDALMWTVRRTAAKCISVSGASIELHCEQFGW